MRRDLRMMDIPVSGSGRNRWLPRVVMNRINRLVHGVLCRCMVCAGWQDGTRNTGSRQGTSLGCHRHERGLVAQSNLAKQFRNDDEHLGAGHDDVHIRIALRGTSQDAVVALEVADERFLVQRRQSRRPLPYEIVVIGAGLDAGDAVVVCVVDQGARERVNAELGRGRLVGCERGRVWIKEGIVAGHGYVVQIGAIAIDALEGEAVGQSRTGSGTRQ